MFVSRGGGVNVIAGHLAFSKGLGGDMGGEGKAAPAAAVAAPAGPRSRGALHKTPPKATLPWRHLSGIYPFDQMWVAAVKKKSSLVHRKKKG